MSEDSSEKTAFRKTFHIGRRSREKEGGSAGKANLSTTLMRPTQITSLDTLNIPELDSVKDDLSLNNLKKVVKSSKKSGL